MGLPPTCFKKGITGHRNLPRRTRASERCSSRLRTGQRAAGAKKPRKIQEAGEMTENNVDQGL